tara:strand:+ start:25 stop:447 length:423 start_codon:yes stop_codon:yes gene_type:complete
MFKNEKFILILNKMAPKKEKKPKKSKKYVAPEEKEPVQEPVQEEQTESSPQQEEFFDPEIRIKFSFINTIYRTLLVANSRISWEPDELMPVGSLLRDLKLINQQMVDFIEEKNKESQNKPDSDKSESEKSDVDEESSSTA